MSTLRTASTTSSAVICSRCVTCSTSASRGSDSRRSFCVGTSGGVAPLRFFRRLKAFTTSSLPAPCRTSYSHTSSSRASSQRYALLNMASQTEDDSADVSGRAGKGSGSNRRRVAGYGALYGSANFVAISTSGATPAPSPADDGDTGLDPSDSSDSADSREVEGEVGSTPSSSSSSSTPPLTTSSLWLYLRLGPMREGSSWGGGGKGCSSSSCPSSASSFSSSSSAGWSALRLWRSVMPFQRFITRHSHSMTLRATTSSTRARLSSTRRTLFCTPSTWPLYRAERRSSPSLLPSMSSSMEGGTASASFISNSACSSSCARSSWWRVVCVWPSSMVHWSASSSQSETG